MSKSLTVVPPLAITPAMLIATNVTEADHAAWSSGATYAAGDRVIVLADHAIYESLQASNTNHTPVGDATDTWWVKVSPTNRWKCFDASNSTQTARSTSITYQLRPGSAVTALAALNLTGAQTIRVRVIDPTFGTVYDKTTSLSVPLSAANWYSWFFGARTTQKTFIALDLPSFPFADVYVDLTGDTSLAVGVLQIGQAQDLGIGVQQGARLGINDYSRKETNDFGDIVVVQRAFAKRASFTVVLERGQIDGAIETLTALRTTACLWIASDTLSSAVIFGFYKSFDVLVAYYSHADCQLDIEGLT